MDQGKQDVLVHLADEDWVPLYDDISFKLLRYSEETGSWTVVFKCLEGSSFAAHFHHGPGEFYMIKGRMVYRAGEAVTGDYGYEPLGAFHERTNFPEETEILFTNHGPIGFIDDEGNTIALMDYAFVRDKVAEHKASKAA